MARSRKTRSGGENHRVASVDGVLAVAQQMGKANLLACAVVGLSRETVGQPDRREVAVPHFPDDRLAAAGRYLVQHRRRAAEHPLPGLLAGHPGARLVAADHLGTPELVGDVGDSGVDRRLSSATM